MSRRTTRATAGDLYATLSIQPVSGNHIAPSTTMYLSNQYNHPAFNKLYLGPNLSGGKGAGSAIPKAPKAPEKPGKQLRRVADKQRHVARSDASHIEDNLRDLALAPSDPESATGMEADKD